MCFVALGFGWQIKSCSLSSDCALQFLASFGKLGLLAICFLPNAQDFLHFCPSCPDYYFTDAPLVIEPSGTLQIFANCSESFLLVLLHSGSSGIPWTWCMYLVSPCVMALPPVCLQPGLPAVLARDLPWLHKTPPLAMLWPSCAAAACSTAEMHPVSSQRRCSDVTCASNDPSMLITAKIFLININGTDGMEN